MPQKYCKDLQIITRIYEGIVKQYEKYFETAGKSCKKKPSLYKNCSMRVWDGMNQLLFFKSICLLEKYRLEKLAYFFLDSS